MGSPGICASFVIRVVRDRRGRISGVIERVATGVKETFQGMEAIGAVIARMVRRDAPTRSLPPGSRCPRKGTSSRVQGRGRRALQPGKLESTTE